MRTIVFLALLFAVILVTASISLELMQLDSQVSVDAVRRAQGIVSAVGEKAWDFGRPLLQLVVVLLILQWLLTNAGIKLSFKDFSNWNVQVFIAVLIIATFCISALGDLPGLGYTKDLALIVIGFYFGTRARNVQPPDRDDPSVVEHPGQKNE